MVSPSAEKPEDGCGRAARWALLAAGSEMVSFTLSGLLLDYLLGTLPVLTVVLTMAGVPAAFVLLIRLSRTSSADAVRTRDRKT